MVFLALTPSGLEEAMRAATAVGGNVWCGASAISEADFGARKLAALTRLHYSPAASGRESLGRALDTIGQHHPGETVWVEGVT
jgi:hypothetical protein